EMPFVGQAELLEEARRAANDRPRRSRQCGQYPLDEKRRQLCRRGGAPMVEQQVRIYWWRRAPCEPGQACFIEAKTSQLGEGLRPPGPEVLEESVGVAP